MTHNPSLPDPRFLLARPDVADQALEGLFRALDYRATRAMQGAAAVADVRDDAGNLISQLLSGEAFDVLSRDGDRAFGACRRDGVVGWVEVAALQDGVRAPTHRVASVGGPLPLNALVDPARDAVGDVALMPIGEFASDLAAVAEDLLGVAHVLGGRSDRGTDCAGLVQACLIACGRAAPRYSDGQAELGRAVSLGDIRRGDLIVWGHSRGGAGWRGHSAIALDAGTLIHASGRAGAVVVEPIAAENDKRRAEGFDAPLFRRI